VTFDCANRPRPVQSTPWLICPPGAARRLRLYCFPYSGGNAVSFVPWQREIDPAIELCAVQLPGRGARFREAPCTSFAVLMDALVEVLALQLAQNGGPYAFYGHSLGSLIAFELARHCRRRGLPLPQRLILSGCNAPPFPAGPKRLHELPDAELIEKLREYNGTPQELLDNRELMKLLLPAVRADFALGADYHYVAEPPLDVPLTVLAGRQDAHVEEARLLEWQRETSAAFRLHWFEGDHFFINDQRAAVLACLENEVLG
jgi:surfactin synthase thioesterase subunit